MRILHIADVHLDRPFVGLSRDAARQRRADVNDAFRRCVAAARTHEVDLLTIGGDLWEDENVTPDTRASVAHQLGELDVPVVLVAGNHDPYLRGGAYQRTVWPPNVRVVDTPAPVQVETAAGVTLWAASWTEHPLTIDFHDLTPPDPDSTQLLLLHGTATDYRFGIASSHCPFDPADAKRAGIDLVLAGHIHTASTANGVVYPGSPEPLNATETGRHCFALIEIENRRIEVELVDVNRRRYVSAEVDCSDASSSAEIEARIDEQLVGDVDPQAVIKIRLAGETAPDCALDRELLVAKLERDFAAVTIEDSTTPAIDYGELARRHSADGLFVTSMLEQIDQSPDAAQRLVLQMALQAGVRAMAGRKDVLSVD
jgi:DNA repair exonuclease SbcCD nuclease subunit